MTSPKHARFRDDEEEITIERRRIARTEPLPFTEKITRRVPVVDVWLLAVARGEADPDVDPFGGLIPLDDFDGLMPRDDDD